MTTLKEQISEESKAGNMAKKLVKISEGYAGVKGNYDVYADDKGNKVTIYDNALGVTNMVEIENAQGKKVSINYSSLEYHGVSEEVIGKNGKPIKNYDNHGKIMRDIRKSVLKGTADLGALMEEYKDFECKPVTQAELDRRESLQAIKDEWKPIYDKLYNVYGGGMTTSGFSHVFDESSQTYKAGWGMYLSQKSNGYAATVDFDAYGKLSAVTLASPQMDSKKWNSIYVEVLNVENLQKKGLTQEQAEAKMKEVAEQIRQGKDLKQLFFDNREYMGPESSKNLSEAMNKQQEQPKNDTITRNDEVASVSVPRVSRYGIGGR